MGRRNPKRLLPDSDEGKLAKDNLVIATNNLQKKHDDLLLKTKEHEGNMVIAESKHKETKEQVASAEQKLLDIRQSIILESNKLSTLKENSRIYDEEFKNKVSCETQRIEKEIPELIKEHADVKQTTENAKIFLSETIHQHGLEKIAFENTKIEHKNTADKIVNNNNKILSQENEMQENTDKISKQDALILKNDGKILSQNQTLLAIEQKIAISKPLIASNEIKIDEQKKEIIANDAKIKEQSTNYDEFEQSVINISIRERKLADFAESLEKKAKVLGVHIKLT